MEHEKNLNEPHNPKHLKETAKKKSVMKEILSWILTIGIPVAIVLLLNAFVGKLVVVNGDSMYPTLHDRDLMIVQSIAYTPQAGDIAVMSTDPDSVLGGKYIVKRVIATEGQRVTVNYDTNTVDVDGIVLEEDYLNTEYGDVLIGSGYESWTVPQGTIFVLGDNRNDSTDSRSSAVGFVTLDQVLGKTIVTIPLGSILPEREQ